MAASKRNGSAGIGVDASGGPVVDPTQNVKDLSEQANKRQDDLRVAERRYNDLRDKHQRAMAVLRSSYEEKLSAKESSRLDSIRQVDRDDVAKTAASANLAIGTLAKQTTDLATTLQNQVQATASAAETRRTADMSEVNKRVSALELASSASAGKQTVADPMLEKLMARMDALLSNNAGAIGERRGMSDAAKILIGFLGLVVTLFTIYTFIGGNKPQVIYVPASPSTTTAASK